MVTAASACTIVLGRVPRDKICVTSRARLGFHAAWKPAGSNGRKIANSEATRKLSIPCIHLRSGTGSTSAED